MTDKLTDFTDTSDVSDAAIEWVSQATNCSSSAKQIRAWVGQGFKVDRIRIIAARLIQAHRPELLVDPVDAAVNGFMQETGLIARETREAAKHLYLLGLEAGKAQG